MPSLGTQTNATGTSITLAIAQGILPNGATDRIYATTSWPASELSTPVATLSSGGNTTLTLTDLAPGILYWISAWRHSRTAVTRWVEPAWSSNYMNTQYRTLDANTIAPFFETTYTEDWSNGLAGGIDAALRMGGWPCGSAGGGGLR